MELEHISDLSSFPSDPDMREKARFNMIEQQIRTWEVLDSSVLQLFQQIPREDFVPAEYKRLAFADIEIPIGHGQTMLPPKIEGRILQTLEVRKTDTVLEIGTGSGHLTALLASLAHQVHSVEIIAELSEQAQKRLETRGVENAMLEVGDAAHGWAAHGPYDVIVFTGSLPVLPKNIQQQLKVGGRLFAVVGEPPVMEAVMIQCIATDNYRQQAVFETCLPPLLNAPQPPRFEF
jgi:protein-L-isoaspartate(D-aspartate) O-methyltransferase